MSRPVEAPGRGLQAYQASKQLQDVERAAHRLERMYEDPALQPYREALVGGVVPFLPTRPSLAGAVAVLDQVAQVLRHQAGQNDGEAAP